MKIKVCIILIILLFYPIFIYSAPKIHPYNIKLMKQGYLKAPPKYHPEIPRITAQLALNLYRANKALFILISYHDKDLIPGAIHLTEGKVKKINLNKLPLKKNQYLVVY